MTTPSLISAESAAPPPLLQNVVITSEASLVAGDERDLASSYTPVEPGESLVIAVVRARWQFAPAPR